MIKHSPKSTHTFMCKSVDSKPLLSTISFIRLSQGSDPLATILLPRSTQHGYQTAVDRPLHQSPVKWFKLATTVNTTPSCNAPCLLTRTSKSLHFLLHKTLYLWLPIGCNYFPRYPKELVYHEALYAYALFTNIPNSSWQWIVKDINPRNLVRMNRKIKVPQSNYTNVWAV